MTTFHCFAAAALAVWSARQWIDLCETMPEDETVGVEVAGGLMAIMGVLCLLAAPLFAAIGFTKLLLGAP